MDQGQVKKSEIGQEGEGAGGVNVDREVGGAQAFIAELKVPKTNLVGAEAKMKKSTLANDHLGEKNSFRKKVKRTVVKRCFLFDLKIQIGACNAFIVEKINTGRR